MRGCQICSDKLCWLTNGNPENIEVHFRLEIKWQCASDSPLLVDGFEISKDLNIRYRRVQQVLIKFPVHHFSPTNESFTWCLIQSAFRKQMSLWLDGILSHLESSWCVALASNLAVGDVHQLNTNMASKGVLVTLKSYQDSPSFQVKITWKDRKMSPLDRMGVL